MATAVIPDQGMVEFATKLFGSGFNFTLGLFKNNFTPVKGSVFGDFTAADFSGYIAQSVTWGSVSISSNIAQSIATAITFTRSVGATSNTCYGWWLYSVTNSKVYAANLFSSPKNFNSSGDGATITLTALMGDL